MNNNNSNNNRKNEWTSKGGAIAAGFAAAVISGAALIGAAAYYYTTDSKPKPQSAASNNPNPSRNIRTQSATESTSCSTPRQSTTVSTSRSTPIQGTTESTSVSSYLTNMICRMATVGGSTAAPVGRRRNVPANPVITNLNSLFDDIYVRYIQLKDSDFELHYRVFDKIFQDLHKKMKDVDPYYKNYSSTVQFAGSHYDNLRIKKPDEFDMDIVIGLPLNINANPLDSNGSDIIIEQKNAGFVQLKMGIQFQKLPMRDREKWLVNRAAYEWKDDSNYLLRSNFSNWFKSVVNRALNLCEVSAAGKPLYYVDGVPYTIDKSESGPAMTLFIRNRSRNFQMDVDLVPALKFPENRWPIGRSYRDIPPHCRKGYWMVVGKPNKASPFAHDQNRSWRLALHNQERELMHDSYNLRQAIRMIKKLRDSQDMKKIASYYVKTLFFWEIIEKNDPSFWKKNNPATLFKLMVGRLHAALVAGNIPYFWNKSNNLIGSVNRRVLDDYAAKLVPLMAVLERPDDYKLVAKYLLTPNEFADYNARFLHI